jgi:hypothetical protein
MDKTVTLFLASWQKRMIMDCMSGSGLKLKAVDKLTRVTIAIIDRRQWVMYRQPVDAIKAGDWNLYLTDEQIAIVAAKAGIRAKIAALNVSQEMLRSGAIAFQ